MCVVQQLQALQVRGQTLRPPAGCWLRVRRRDDHLQLLPPPPGGARGHSAHHQQGATGGKESMSKILLHDIRF